MLDELDASLFYALLRFEEAALALRVTLKLQIVEEIGEESLSLGELGQRFGFSRQASRTFFSLLAAMRIVEKRNNGLAIAPRAKQALTAKSKTSRAPYLAMGMADDVDQLIAQLRGEPVESPPLYGEEGGPETLMDIDEVGSTVAYGLSSRARNFAKPLAEAVAANAGGAKVIADIGAGSPYVAEACLQLMPQIEKVILVDRPNGMRFARQIAIERGIDISRIEFCEEDFFQPVPAADIYCVSNTAHDWLREDYLRLMRNLHNCATGERIVCIHEPLLLSQWTDDREWIETLWMACYALTLFKLTAGQGSCYAVEEHDQILREAAFERTAEPVKTCDGCTALFYRATA